MSLNDEIAKINAAPREGSFHLDLTIVNLLKNRVKIYSNNINYSVNFTPDALIIIS